MEVFNSILGSRCQLDTANINSLEEFKRTVCREQGIDIDNVLILVAPSGQPLKDLAAQRVFIYDKKWTQEKFKCVSGEPADGMTPQSDEDNTVSPHRKTICAEAANVAIAYLSQTLASSLKTLKKLKSLATQLEEDIEACEKWRRYYDALQHIPELNAELTDLIDKDKIEEDFSILKSIWSSIPSKLQNASSVSEELRARTAIGPVTPAGSMAEARKRLIGVISTVGQAQLSIKTKLRKPLGSLAEEIKRAEELKAQVAKVIDLPFLYGVLIIESARRRKWRHDFYPIWNSESERQREWLKHYGAKSVGPIVERLDKIGQFHIFQYKPQDQMDPQMNGGQDINADIMGYLQTLESLNLGDVCRDLKSELAAMKRQLARSTSASISSLMPASIQGGILGVSQLHNPSTSHLPPATPQLQQQSQLFLPMQSQSQLQNLQLSSSPSNAAAQYEARIRKLETMLMQSRLGSKSHELEIIRAETRAEARAEARAEVKVEQQDARINELEKQNLELADRLKNYVQGLETVLNSMGLQTSRVDPETGSYDNYSINRVMGLSKRTTAPASSGDANTESGVSSPSDSNQGSRSSRQSDRTSSQANDSIRTVSVQRLMEQTFVDNQVLYEAVSKRFGDVERLARKLQIEGRRLKDQNSKLERELRQRVALRAFRAEDLILFLPTRDTRRQPNPWAAFNAGAPHYFLHPKHAEQLQNREYLIARVSNIERYVAGDDDGDNIFQLPAGVEWFLISIHGEWGV